VTNETLILAGTAASIGFIHTLLGPDHYLPFIAMSKARGWSKTKTAVITALCGLGHVMSSVVLGFLGVFLGLAVFKLESLEAMRGDWAGWLLIAFGLVYMLWGIRQAIRSRMHEHRHSHGDGEVHTHHHSHIGGHSHVHAGENSRNPTPWVLFTIFVLGPCEPLIPLIMYPAAKLNL
jgi:nickel/cobalt transporter (NicO) family protein